MTDAITITVDGERLRVTADTSIAAAVMMTGRAAARKSVSGEARGPVCGMGICFECRVTVDGKVKFACVDGPEFDAHGVDFDELARRNRAYSDQERITNQEHLCRIGLGQ